MDCLEQKLEEILKVNQWQGFVSGKVDGALAVLEVLKIDKERSIEVLAEAIGLSIATATDFVNKNFSGTEYSSERQK